MNRIVFVLLLLLFGQFGFANMASPMMKGTSTSSAFSSRSVDILKEKINIKLNEEFNSASFVIEYFIKTDKEGKQIPLLFHAMDYQGDFKIWVDGKEVSLLVIPNKYLVTHNTPFEGFSNYFNSTSGYATTTIVYWEKKSAYKYPLNDLKYFEVDLNKGEHTIRVEYTASAWRDGSQWVNEYSFHYSLSPAKHWKSFGELEITIDASEINSIYTTNLGSATNGSLEGIAVWKFSKLPSEVIEISLTPSISAFAGALIFIGPGGLTYLFAILLGSVHFLLIKKFGISNPTYKYSGVFVVGSIVIPLFILIGYIFSFVLIDTAIGSHAGNNHGYVFFIVFSYPLIAPIYWVLMLKIYKYFKRKDS